MDVRLIRSERSTDDIRGASYGAVVGKQVLVGILPTLDKQSCWQRQVEFQLLVVSLTHPALVGYAFSRDQRLVGGCDTVDSETKSIDQGLVGVRGNVTLVARLYSVICPNGNLASESRTFNPAAICTQNVVWLDCLER